MTAAPPYTGPDYSHLIGKPVRIPAPRPRDVIAGRLESWNPLADRCHTAWIRRRSGRRTYVGGSFRLEETRRPAPASEETR
ncbi:hypothetical protein [Streptosporangium sandarakinum]